MKWLRIWRFLRGYGIIILEGCLVERLLELLRRENLPLWDVKRIKDGVRFCTNRHGIRFLEAYRTEHLHIKMRVESRGTLRIASRTRQHFALAILSGCLFAASIASLRFYWMVDVSNVPASHRQAVQTVLDESGITFPIAKRDLDAAALRDHLLLQLPELSFAQVHGHGVSLHIDAVLRAQMPQVWDAHAARQDIVSPCDAKILSIAVTSGTAMVQAEDNVRAGDVLIAGVAGRPGFERDVQAQGRIEALVFYTDTVYVDRACLALPTGKTDQAQSLIVFGFEIPLKERSSSFENDEKVRTRTELFSAGMPMPFYIQTVTWNEVSFGTAQQQIFLAQQMALDKTMRQMHEQAQIIDTYYEHKIQGGRIQVSCTLTAKLLIATIQEVYAQ